MTESGKSKGNQQLDQARLSDRIPLHYGDDPLIWACWLYYEEGRTQRDIADIMGVSRPTVNAYLAEARTRGIVNISIEPSRLKALSTAQELKRNFGLEECVIVPDDDGATPLFNRLGLAGSQTLDRLLKPADTLVVSWGRTVLSVAEQMKRQSLPDVTVIQATGGTRAGFSYTPEHCAATVAKALGAQLIGLSAPAIVTDASARFIFLQQPLIKDQFGALARANKALFGIASLKPNSTILTSGFFQQVPISNYLARGAVGVVAGRFIDSQGRSVDGPLDERTIGISLAQLKSIGMRIAVCGGFDKVPAILAALRGGYISTLVTDASTGNGILNAAGITPTVQHAIGKSRQAAKPAPERTQRKKFLNNPDHAVDEMLEGAVSVYSDYMSPINGSNRALLAVNGPRDNKVGLVIGGGAGHEPGFLGYVGKGIADAVAIGNVFSSPPPKRILECARAASKGSGVLFVYGNCAGDVMNFEMAAELAEEEGIAVRTVIITDDIASSPVEDRDGRRGVAGNFFIFKIAGAACDHDFSLEECVRLAQKANNRTYTMGVALEACSLPQTRRLNFDIGQNDIEFGMGIHGERGVSRGRMQEADAIVDRIMERIFLDMKPTTGTRVAVLINSLGATPDMELHILYRRVEQRLRAKQIKITRKWIGRYCTSLDMVGASISILDLDDELAQLLQSPCDTPQLKIK